ncbi:uncharacterized protein TEOVI_000031600 [Trypanosoma equiperdum]|uniref:Ion transport domain-containing protein n=2 Tax=Trypanozoon TaxID=39700 RepID=Q387R0_TRYB2|nr:hypothetical protein, conserved [Trypanosoma brucei brucei TREU927]EAN78962.1 hypothetical protein, conserved [Trypanosoma brucei brucei TREU927]SCU66493.1 hypothetical protein, conserved [Trypanosoma equiperdum]
MSDGLPWPSSTVSALQRIPFRERLKNFYFLIFSAKTNRCILATSIVLLLISVVRSSCVTTLWYHTAEAIVTLLFVCEVTIRLMVMRGNFWDSSYNVAEALSCVVCITIFFVLHYTRQMSSSVEHQFLIALRYLGQVLRLAGLVAVDTVLLGSGEATLHLSFVGTRPCVVSGRENLCDVL